jgi:hypothetical protein
VDSKDGTIGSVVPRVVLGLKELVARLGEAGEKEQFFLLPSLAGSERE